ncbi:MAG: hypothetical protein [Sanya fiers-like virus 30]|nr:MAG: hypothetical protein [Sanya fiers-like virus 30]
MAQQASLVLNNGAATPVAKTFIGQTPYQGADGPAVWRLPHGTTPMGDVRIEVGMTRNSQGTTRIPVKVIVPNVTTDPVYGPKLVSKCIYDSRNGGFIIPENAVQSQIDDLYAFVANLYTNAVFKTWVRTFEPAN